MSGMVTRRRRPSFNRGGLAVAGRQLFAASFGRKSYGAAAAAHGTPGDRPPAVPIVSRCRVSPAPRPGRQRCGQMRRSPEGCHSHQAGTPRIVRARPDRRAANLHRLPTAGSGSGRCGTSDSQVPGGRREVHRRPRQEHHREPDSHRGEGTPHERNDAKAGQDDTSGKAHACEPAEVAVHEWPDYALHARSRGRCPPRAQASGSGVVIGCVHRDTSRQLWCRLSDHLSI